MNLLRKAKNRNCENSLCLYSVDKICLLNTTDINELGFCDACIVVSIPDDVLNKYKEVQRQKLENRFNQ